MKKFTVLILFFVFAVAIGLTFTDDSQAAPSNLNNTGIVVLVCDSGGDVNEDASENMSSQSPAGLSDGVDCIEEGGCGRCAEELGESGCHRVSVGSGGDNSDATFAITLLCPGKS